MRKLRQIVTQNYLHTVRLAIAHYKRVLDRDKNDPWAPMQLSTLQVLEVDLEQELAELAADIAVREVTQQDVN